MTQVDKLQGLLLTLSNLQESDGYFFRLRIREDSALLKVNNVRFDECNFYFSTLKELKWIAPTFLGMTQNGDYGAEFSLTFEALKETLKLQADGIHSNNCFVAMAFKQETLQIRSAIKSAIENTGFNSILIDEVHHDSIQTINDAIIAAIKKSKFCIADFTNQASGVYYESGFAAGQGKKVIYCCQEDHFPNSHFDTNHFQHILYRTPKELEQRLVDKIEAFIR